jgi:sec-independent protein translocase protein TatA
MFGLGIGELLVVLVIVMVLFNRRLPDLGAAIGGALRKFRKAVHDSDEIGPCLLAQMAKRQV